jgi:hypothetical protein|tara:strand:+ start:4113 stop:4508 length:396 start_codon:yes stop_codon:yes gene_type:complete
MMKALKINVIDQTITEVDYSDYNDICKNLSTTHKAVSLFTRVLIDYADYDGDAIFVDDEGLLIDTNYGFKFEGYNGVLMGNGLVLGSELGETSSPDITLADLKKKITFLGLQEINMGYHGFTVVPLEGGLA